VSGEALRIAVIGAGKRAQIGYVKHFAYVQPKAVLAAVADPNPENCQLCLKYAGENVAENVGIYTDWQELLAKETSLDGVIIATPNVLHYKPAIACIELGVPAIALEKPLASSPEECRDITQLARRKNVRILLGFVLRETPFYKKIKELIVSNAIGNIISVQADELVGINTTIVMFRSTWRRYTNLSGGSLLEKCSHDMDLLNWLTQSRPISLNSFGGRRIFQPNPALPDHCFDCPVKQSCMYAETKPIDAPDMANACIFNIESDVVDHQSVQIAYENGVVANFLMNFNAGHKSSSRSISIVGVKGRIWGRLDANQLYHLDYMSGKLSEYNFTNVHSGHHGGDVRHVESFLRSITGDASKDTSNAYDGYLSAMMCFAANRSMAEHKQIHFIYPGNDEILLS